MESVKERESIVLGLLNLETAVGSQKSAQALGAPGKIKKCLITTEVTTTFFISPGTPISYTAFLRPTAVSRLNHSSLEFLNLVIPRCFATGLPLRSPLWKRGLGGFSNYTVSLKYPVSCGGDLYVFRISIFGFRYSDFEFNL